jgi:hypothetical protein
VYNREDDNRIRDEITLIVAFACRFRLLVACCQKERRKNENVFSLNFKRQQQIRIYGHFQLEKIA